MELSGQVFAGGGVSREGLGSLARLYKRQILDPKSKADKGMVCVWFSRVEGRRLALPPPKIERHEAFRQSTGVERVYTEKK